MSYASLISASSLWSRAYLYGSTKDHTKQKTKLSSFLTDASPEDFLLAQRFLRLESECPLFFLNSFPHLDLLHILLNLTYFILGIVSVSITMFTISDSHLFIAGI